MLEIINELIRWHITPLEMAQGVWYYFFMDTDKPVSILGYALE